MVIALGMVAGIDAALHGSYLAAAVSVAVAAVAWVIFVARVRTAHFSVFETALALLGLPIFAVLLLRSHIHYRLRHSVEWKGRTYPVAAGEKWSI